MASNVFTPSAGDAIERAADVALRGYVLRGRSAGAVSTPPAGTHGERALGVTSSFAGTPLPVHSSGATDLTG
jgi:hypothetical protein